MDVSQQDPSSSESSDANKFQAFVTIDENFKNLILENKFVQAISKAEHPVSYSHFFASRGTGAIYMDLNDKSVEDLSALQGDVFMTSYKNEFFKVFDPTASFVRKAFKHQLRTSTCGSVSVMKLQNVKIHCDDDAVGEQIVVANCGEEKYNLLFFTKNKDDEYTQVDTLTVKPWMMYLLSDEYRLMFHAVQNADKPRSIIRLGFFETSSISQYLKTTIPDKNTPMERTVCAEDGVYKRNLKELRTKLGDNFFGGPGASSHQSVLKPSTWLCAQPHNSTHGFLYFNPSHVRNIFEGESYLKLASETVIQLIKDNVSSVRNW